MSLKVTQQNDISVYTISGSNTGRSLPDWLARKRKRSLKNDEAWQNRIELIQDFEFEEASQCIKVSEDGEYAMATGTYKPQQHIYHLPSSALKYARHTSSLNVKFILLSTDYTKSLHLQTDRSLEFHTAMGCHHTTRIPRYGRDLAYLKPFAHAIIPADGKDVFRLDLEGGRFLKPLELGGYEGNGLEGDVSSVECVGVAEGSHGLMAFGTDVGTTEFWDPRSRTRIGILAPPPKSSVYNNPLGEAITPGVTAVQFASNGLTVATGNSAGIITLYDLRSPTPLLSKDQGYGFPIQTLSFLHASTSRTAGIESAYESSSTPKVLSACKRIIKIWDATTGSPWTSIEPSVDINDVCVIPNSGMILTANEGREMHSFLIPALGPSPWWCAHLDTQIEQLADKHVNDPDAYVSGATTAANEVVTYDNYKFLTKPELRTLNLDHLLGGKGANLVRPYMHGYFVDQRLYDEARLIADPFEWERERTRMVKDKIEKERESRIRTSGKTAPKVKINKRLAERLTSLEDKLERTRLRAAEEAGEEGEQEKGKKKPGAVLKDDRFNRLFQNPDFEVDENTLEFQQLNPSTKPRGRTAAEEEDASGEDATTRHKAVNFDSDSDSESASDSEDQQIQKKPPQKDKVPEMRISTSTYKKSGHDTRGYPTSSVQKRINKEKSFASRVASGSFASKRGSTSGRGAAQVMGDREVTFFASGSKSGRGGIQGERGRGGGGGKGGRGGRSAKDRRSASGNAFRREGIAK